MVVSLLSDPMWVVAANIFVTSSSVRARAEIPADILKSRWCSAMRLFVALGNEHNQINQTQQRLTWKYFNSPVMVYTEHCKVTSLDNYNYSCGTFAEKTWSICYNPLLLHIYMHSNIGGSCATIILQSLLTTTSNTEETGKQSGAVMVAYFTHLIALTHPHQWRNMNYLCICWLRILTRWNLNVLELFE